MRKNCVETDPFGHNRGQADWIDRSTDRAGGRTPANDLWATDKSPKSGLNKMMVRDPG